MLNPSSDDDHRWMSRFYHFRQIDSQGDRASSPAGASEISTDQFIDSTADPAAGNNNTLTSGHKLPSGSPRNIGSSNPGLSPKPVRRRSRASKRTPATVLNANANNFRALVQQFTGCPSAAVSFKGPVNLSFSNYQQQHRGELEAALALNNYPYNSDNHMISSSSSSTGASVSVSSYSYGHGQQQSVLDHAHQLTTTGTASYINPQRGSDVFFSFSNIAGTASTDGFDVMRQIMSPMDMETAVSLDEGFAAMDTNQH